MATRCWERHSQVRLGGYTSPASLMLLWIKATTVGSERVTVASTLRLSDATTTGGKQEVGVTT